jgi:hypothetical protein
MIFITNRVSSTNVNGITEGPNIFINPHIIIMTKSNQVNDKQILAAVINYFNG